MSYLLMRLISVRICDYMREIDGINIGDVGYDWFALTASWRVNTLLRGAARGVVSPWVMAKPIPQIPAACFHRTDLPTACGIRTAAMTG